MYVAVDNPKGITQYGGTVSAPIAKSIMKDIISKLNIEKSDYTLEKKYQWFDEKYYAIPNIVGLSKKEAIKLLKNFNIEYTGSGEYVKLVSPSEGTILKEYSTVRILLTNDN